jgi:limonene-1,2-epoxide hydrolase
MTDNARLVRDFCEVMMKRDAEAARPFLARDAVYHNTGMPATVGVDAIVENLAAQMAMFPHSYEYRIINLAAQDDAVLTERIDMIEDAQGGRHGVPVMGTFVVKDNQITRWTDYFDTALPAKMLTGADYTGLIPDGY